MVRRADDDDAPGLSRSPSIGLQDLQLGVAGQQLHDEARVVRGEVLRDDEGGAVRLQGREELLEGLEAASGGTDADDAATSRPDGRLDPPWAVVRDRALRHRLLDSRRRRQTTCLPATVARIDKALTLSRRNQASRSGRCGRATPPA